MTVEKPPVLVIIEGMQEESLTAPEENRPLFGALGRCLTAARAIDAYYLALQEKYPEPFAKYVGGLPEPLFYVKDQLEEHEKAIEQVEGYREKPLPEDIVKEDRILSELESVIFGTTEESFWDRHIKSPIIYGEIPDRTSKEYRIMVRPNYSSGSEFEHEVLPGVYSVVFLSNGTIEGRDVGSGDFLGTPLELDAIQKTRLLEILDGIEQRAKEYIANSKEEWGNNYGMIME